MDIDDAGLAFIERWEGFRANVYLDTAGKATIGIGHLIKQGESFTTLTHDEALDLLRQDAAVAVAAVNDLVQYDLTQNQFNALVSFVYNLGQRNFRTSTMLRKLNNDDFDGAAQEFPKWNMAGGKIDIGLANRRAAEKRLFEQE